MCSLVTLPDVIIDKIQSYVIFTPKNNDIFRYAVHLWCDDKRSAHKLYGHISLWNTQKVTAMNNLFYLSKHFNSVIS